MRRRSVAYQFFDDDQFLKPAVVGGGVSVSPSPISISLSLTTPNAVNADPPLEVEEGVGTTITNLLRNVEVLKKEAVNKLMTDLVTNPQTIYTVNIPASKLAVGSRIRFQFNLNRSKNEATSIDVDEPQTNIIDVLCDLTCPLGQYAEAIYEPDSTTVVPAAGPAIRVPDVTSFRSFIGYAAIYVPAQTGLLLVKWFRQPLSDLGTIIGKVQTTLNAGDTIRLSASGTNENQYSVYVNGAIKIGPVTDNEISTTNSCIALITVDKITEDLFPVFDPTAPDPGDSDNTSDDDGGDDFGGDDFGGDDTGDTGDTGDGGGDDAGGDDAGGDDDGGGGGGDDDGGGDGGDGE